MSLCRLGLIVVVMATPFLQGCLPAIAAAQVAPFAAAGLAVNGAEEHSPFQSYLPHTAPSPDDDLATIDARIRRAECGEAESQYWLAAHLNNNFNSTPDNVEIYMWYRLSEMGGYRPASDKLSALGDAMSVSQISQARARARAWHPAIEDCPSRG